MAEGDCSDEENDLIVADCFAMLANGSAGRPYKKADHNRHLQQRIGRSLSPELTATPCSIRTARLWRIVAVLRDTSRDLTRCTACRPSWSWLFSTTVFRFGRRTASAIASASS